MKQPQITAITGASRQPVYLLTLAVGMLAILLVAACFSVMYGVYPIQFSQVMSALSDGSTTESKIVRELRFPRTLTTILIGAQLAVAGAVMQGLTRNPLASPSVFGINAGASLFVVLTLFMFPAMPGFWRMPGAFAGALITALAVYGISRLIQGGQPEIKLALTGMAMQAFLMVGVQTLLLFNETKAELVMFWLVGSVIGRTWADFMLLVPWGILGLGLAWLMGRSLTLFSLGEEMAQGLGQRIGFIRLAGLLIAVVLAGSAVAVAGPIGFVGLIVPHIVRRLVGNDYRIVIPFCALTGAALLTLADVGSRWINFPSETAVGIVTALIGAPFFIYLSQRKGRKSA